MSKRPPLWLLFVFMSMMVVGMLCTLVGAVMEVMGG